MLNHSKRVAVDDPDFISTLPNNLLENILLHLPIRDAVRTSVLSKKWVHIWETLPELSFNSSTFGPSMTPERMLLTIFQILLVHRGPILKFRLSHLRLHACHHIDHILKFISMNGIQNLRLLITWTGPYYRVPSCIFSCLELKYLEFCRCSLEPFGTFNGLKSLVNLKCRNVIFKPNFFDNFFVKFPSLESLALIICRNIEHLNIHAPNLKHLEVDSVFQSICLKDTWQLKSVLIEGPDARMSNVDDASLRRTASIVELFGYCHGSLKILYIGQPLLKMLAAGYEPPKLKMNFECLESIVFRDLCFQVEAEIQCAFCFIRNAPYLKQIYIQVYHGEDGQTDAVIEFLKVNDLDDFSFYRLETMTLKFYKGSEPEMEFVKLILSKSPLLKTMFIMFHIDVDTEEKLRILTQLTRFCRASPTAVVDCARTHMEWSRIKQYFSK